MIFIQLQSEVIIIAEGDNKCFTWILRMCHDFMRIQKFFSLFSLNSLNNTKISSHLPVTDVLSHLSIEM